MRNYCSQTRKGPGQSKSATVAQSNQVPTRSAATNSVQSTAQNKGKGPATSQGQNQRLYEMRRSDRPDAPVCQGTLYVHSTTAFLLFDSGATHSFISESCVEMLGLECSDTCEPFIVNLPNGERIIGAKQLSDFPTSI